MVQWAEALQYAALVTNTCYAYQSQPELHQLLLSLVEQVNQRPAVVLERCISLGSLEDMLELAMRYLICGEFPFCQIILRLRSGQLIQCLWLITSRLLAVHTIGKYHRWYPAWIGGTRLLISRTRLLRNTI